LRFSKDIFFNEDLDPTAAVFELQKGCLTEIPYSHDPSRKNVALPGPFYFLGSHSIHIIANVFTLVLFFKIIGIGIYPLLTNLFDLLLASRKNPAFALI